MTDRSISYADLWTIYKQSERYRPQIDHWLNLEKELTILSWQRQAELLDNAPPEVIKAHADLLDDRAKRKLGLEVKKPKKVKWPYSSLL